MVPVQRAAAGKLQARQLQCRPSSLTTCNTHSAMQPHAMQGKLTGWAADVVVVASDILAVAADGRQGAAHALVDCRAQRCTQWQGVAGQKARCAGGGAIMGAVISCNATIRLASRRETIAGTQTIGALSCTHTLLLGSICRTRPAGLQAVRRLRHQWGSRLFGLYTLTAAKPSDHHQ